MSEEQKEIMRALVAAQAALLEVVDNPGAPGAEIMLQTTLGAAHRLGTVMITASRRKRGEN